MKTKLPEVCVVMPVYNGAKTIEMTIKSLIFQTYSNWNCVIVNDGSTDETKNILDKIKDKRFKIIHLEKNKGRGYARQVCLENASGDYLSYLDADDLYHPEKTAIQVEMFRNFPNIQLVTSGIGSYDNKFDLKTIRGLKNAGFKHFNKGDKIDFVPATSMILIEKALKISYNNRLNASEDVDYFSNYLENCDYYITNKVLYYYYEFESVKYFKTIQYAFNSLKRIYYLRNKIKFSVFLSQMFVVLFKMLFYVFFYFILGKRYFVNRRGLVPNNSQISDFESILSKINKDTFQ